MKYSLVFLIIFFTVKNLSAQTLNLKLRNNNALTGSEFAKSIGDSTLTLQQRENLVFDEIKSGNVPDFLRKLTEIKDTTEISNQTFIISYYVLPDYFAIGSNSDFFYVPMTPILAQKVAYLTKCNLPTRKIVDQINENATLRLEPLPIPPSASMTTFSVFKQHDDLIKEQLKSLETRHLSSELTAGNKKDIIISNKIYGEPTNRVVIYGWHQIDGKPIQPVYNKHTNTWADYSHGIRLVQNKVWVNGKKTTIAKVLADKKLCVLLSDEGRIEKSFYPITDYKL